MPRWLAGYQTPRMGSIHRGWRLTCFLPNLITVILLLISPHIDYCIWDGDVNVIHFMNVNLVICWPSLQNSIYCPNYSIDYMNCPIIGELPYLQILFVFVLCFLLLVVWMYFIQNSLQYCFWNLRSLWRLMNACNLTFNITKEK